MTSSTGSNTEREIYLPWYRGTLLAQPSYTQALNQALDEFRTNFHGRSTQALTDPPIFLGPVVNSAFAHEPTHS